MNEILRELAPQVLGALVQRYGDLAACEDALQEASIAAVAQWPRSGVPEDPRAWLIRVARRRLTDGVRAQVSRRRREALLVSLAPSETDERRAAVDDTLELFFMCCHPSLSTASATALTLRAVGGLTTAEIAHAFLVPEATMAQRLSRARQSVRGSGIPFEVLDQTEVAQRLSAVMRTLYLIFNEGYVASSGAALQRLDLSTEAIRLTRLLHRLRPDVPEVTGLLALMLLTDARRDARTDSGGALIPLDAQERARWNRQAIEEGSALTSAAFARGAVGPYQLQAAIASLHDEAGSTETTDWPQILALYGVLLRMSDNPMVALNHTIAFAMVNGPRKGLERLEQLEQKGPFAHQHRLDSARAHLLERAGDSAAAIDAFERAASSTASAPERDYLLLQAARLRAR
ncbi:MAG: polymerase sigma-70 factor, subfamily protein [Myxococcaceae bacterium]|nr:polymerase sigma-70 factor, subfamily protein [Myxococcaceae bacterium]